MNSKKLVSLLVAAAMLFSLLPTAFAAETQAPCELTPGTHDLTDVTITATEDGQSALSVLSGEVTLNIGGEVTLTGAQGGAGIYVAEGATLIITGSGKLTAIGNAGADDKNTGAAGIGGTAANGDSGTIIIDGANVTAYGYGRHGAGIGSGIGGLNGEIIIKNGATVWAQGGHYIEGSLLQSKYGKSDPEGGAGIGGGSSCGDQTIGDITITDSTVTAYGGSKAAGIGGGYWVDCGKIEITDSTVNAYGGGSSAGIGTSRADNGVTANIVLTNSTVNAVGGEYGSAIGAGYNADSCATLPVLTVTVSGGEINAVGGNGGAAIGGGYKTNNLEITITDGAEVTAVAGTLSDKDDLSQNSANAIGSGANGSGTFVGSTVVIAEGTTVEASSNGGKAAIEMEQFNSTETNENTVASSAVTEITLIRNANELYKFAASVNAGNSYMGKTVELGADIDLANELWTPIQGFKGTFDGGKHTISNLKVVATGNQAGLFGSVASFAEWEPKVVLKNLTIENVTIEAGDYSYVGALVGNANAHTEISRVNVIGNIDITGNRFVGGIIGYGYTTVQSCKLEGEGSVIGNWWAVGGVQGWTGEGATKITSCKTIGTGETGLTIQSRSGGTAAVVGFLHSETPHPTVMRKTSMLFPRVTISTALWSAALAQKPEAA